MKSLVREIYTPSPPTIGHKKQSSEDMFRRTGVFNDRLKRKLGEDDVSDKKIDPRTLFRHKQSPDISELEEMKSRFTGKRNSQSAQMSHTSTSFHKAGGF